MSWRLAALFALPVIFAVAYQQYSTSSMSPTLAAIRRSNAEFVGNLKGAPVAVVVGGTSGIGQGMAEAFARWRSGRAHIVIVGRSEAVAKEIIATFPKPTTGEGESWSHEFVKCDATLMKNVKSASEEILARHSKINYLIMSPGFFTTSGRDETPEGIDKKLAVHYYGRWKFIDQLLPALRKAKEEEEEARVLSVLSAGYSGKIDVNDLGLKKGYSVKAAADAAPTYNDLMIESFHERNPDIIFAHSYPGGVLTNLISSARSAWMRAVAPIANTLARPFLVTRHDCAEYMWHGLLTSTDGAIRFDNHGENLEGKRYYGSEEAKTKLWEHTVDATNV
ncbi:hypothetical protein H1R20_g14109, partial [Candolleomyces eurysporus]